MSLLEIMGTVVLALISLLLLAAISGYVWLVVTARRVGQKAIKYSQKQLIDKAIDKVSNKLFK